MVKLAGPALSLDASGTIGGLLTFSKWKGRPYVRTRVIPHNPKSDAQHGIRSMMKFLAQAWAGLSANDKATWEAAADAKKISPFNAFQGANMSHWRDFLPPGKLSTLLRVATPAAVTGTVPFDSGRYASSVITVGIDTDQWGVIVFLSTTTGFLPNWNNVRAVEPIASASIIQVNIGPLANGVYYLRYHTFSNDGSIGTTFVTEDAITIS